jgi:hypothetical protein
MEHGVAGFSQYTPNEEPTVAMGGVFFAASECDPEPCDTRFETNDGDLKSGVFAQAAVDYAPSAVIVFGIGGSATEF